MYRDHRNLKRSEPKQRSANVDEELFLVAGPRHPSPDWEKLLEQGAVPALALGAERRLQRDASFPRRIRKRLHHR